MAYAKTKYLMKGYFNAFFQKTSLQSEHTTLAGKIVSLRVVNRNCTNLPTKLWPNVTFLVYLVDIEWAVPFLQQVFGSFRGIISSVCISDSFVKPPLLPHL